MIVSVSACFTFQKVAVLLQSETCLKQDFLFHFLKFKSETDFETDFETV